MHTSLLAFESPLFMAVVGLLCAAVWLLMWRHVRCVYMLLIFAAWLLLCVHWLLLAVSAGPEPVWSRADMALAVRVLGVVGMAVMGLGTLALLRRMIRRKDST